MAEGAAALAAEAPVSLCPSCAQPLAEAARFCGRCGHSIAHSIDASLAAPPPAAEATRPLARTVLQQGVRPAIVADLETTRDDPAAGARALAMADPPSRGASAAPEASSAGGPPLASGWSKLDPTSPLSRSVAVAHSGPPPPTQLSLHGSDATEAATPAASADTALPARGALPPLEATALGLRPAVAAEAAPPAPVTEASAAPVTEASAAPANLPPLQRTMIGVALPGIAPEPPAAPRAAVAPGERAATMIGVALPGIAPHPPGASSAGAPIPAAAIPSHHRTVLGGIAAVPPTLGAAEGRPLPTPEPDPLPPPPALLRQPTRGAPVVWVAAGLLTLVAVAGAAVALFVRSGEPLAAHAELAPDGREIVALRCETCPDGTSLRAGASLATVRSGKAELQAPRPLAIGSNRLEIAIDRPGLRRDETVTVDVPVRYRVRTDPTALVVEPPSLAVSVEATVGSTVSVDGHDVALDAQGLGRYLVPLAGEASGSTREPKLVERTVAYSVTLPDGHNEAGTLAVKLHVLPLVVDAPLSATTVQQERFTVAGQTRPGARVTVNGAVTAVGADGAFRADVVLPKAGVYPIHVFAAADGLVARSVEGRVTRVTSVAALLRDLEPRTVGIDSFAEGAAPEGKLALVDGEVVEGRLRQGQTILLVSTRPGCPARATCLARVVYGAENSVPRSAHIRAIGLPRGVVEANGKRIPEVEAQVLTMQGPRP